jgi:uncharacterized membrane protein
MDQLPQWQAPREPGGDDSLMRALALIARVVVAVLLAVALTAATTKGCNMVSAPNSSHVLFGLLILAVSWAIAIAYITWLYIVIANWANRMKWEGPK